MSELTVSEEFFQNPTAKLTSYINQFKDFFKSHDTRNQELTTDLGRLPNYRSVSRSVERNSYPNLRHVKVYVPAGMSASYLDLMKALATGISINEKLVDEILSPFARWLATGLSNPRQFQSFSHSHGIRDFNPHDIDGAAMALGDCFTKGHNNNRLMFKDAFARNADVKDVYDQANALGERFVSIDRKQVLDLTDTISDNLEKLNNHLEEGDDDFQMSDTNIQLLAKMSYTVAQEIEFYGNMAYQMTQVAVALTDTAEVLKKAG